MERTLVVAIDPYPAIPSPVELRMAFGRVISSDTPLPRLPAAPSGSFPTIRITNSGQEWRPSSKRRAERFQRQCDKFGVRYLADDVGEFLMPAGGRTITYSLAPDAHAADIQHILTGPALVMALQLSGQFFLHAASFERKGRLFALAAPQGTGKSTLAASLITAGCSVYSDDVLPLNKHEGTIIGRQGQPWIKLWDSALDALGQDASAFEQVMTGYAKRVVPAICPHEDQAPLGAVFLLAPHLQEDCAIEIRQVSKTEGALALVSNVYSPEIMTGALAASTLTFATCIAETVPVRVISYYRSFENLPAIQEAILQDVEGLTNA